MVRHDRPRRALPPCGGILLPFSVVTMASRCLESHKHLYTHKDSKLSFKQSTSYDHRRRPPLPIMFATRSVAYRNEVKVMFYRNDRRE